MPTKFRIARVLIPVLAILAYMAVVLPFAAGQTQPAGSSGFSIVACLSIKDIREKAAADPEWNKNIQTVMDQANSGTQALLRTLKEKGGFDPLRDIDNIIVGVDILDLSKKTPGFVLIVNGRLDETKMVPTLMDISKALGAGFAKDADYNGVAIYAERNAKTGKNGMVAFVGQSALLCNDDSMLRRTIDSVKSGKSLLTGDARMGALAGQINPAATFWVFGQIPDSLTKVKPQAAGAGPNAGGGGPMGLPPDAVKAFAASLDAKQGMDVNVKLTCKDAVSAMQIKSAFDVLRGMAGMALANNDIGLSKESAAKINQTIQKATCETANTMATMSLKLSPAEYAEIEKITKEMAQKATKGMEAKAAPTAGAAGAAPAAAPAGGAPAIGGLGAFGDLMGSLSALGGGAAQGAPGGAKAPAKPAGAPAGGNLK